MSQAKGSVSELIREVMEDEGLSATHRVSDESRLREDLGFDSIALAVLAVRIEAAFGVDVFEAGLALTVAEVKDRIAGRA